MSSKQNGQALRDFREKWGVTMIRLADEAGVGRSWLSRAERGERPLDQDAANRLRAICQRIALQEDAARAQSRAREGTSAN